MSYKILSLKWRPHTFDQIVGQDHITQTLINAISSNRLAQAFLFSGPRGVGKTTTARVLASTINNIENYNECLDIIEMDGASNRGIDEIREIRESVKFPPSMSKHKVYIIDEAHMLTEQAFNALLKTLEEPPEYIIFILATTDPQKMPQTILSRTQRYDFIRIPIDVINDRLKFILDKEEIEYEENALKLISKKSDGSMRDALSILDQVIAFSDSIVSVANIRSAIGLINEEDMYDLMIYITNKDLDGASLKFNQIIDSGISTNNFINDICSFLNDCMLVKINKKNTSTSLSDDLKSRILTNIPLGYIDILKMLNMSLNLSSRLKNLDNPKISLEVLIIKYVSMIKSQNGHSVNSQKNVVDQDLKNTKSSDLEKKTEESFSVKELDFKKKEEGVPVNKENEKDLAQNDIDIKSTDPHEAIRENWSNIIKKIDGVNSKLSSFLEETKIKGVNDGTLTLILENGNNFIKKVLESDSKVITDIIEKDYKIVVEIKIEVSGPAKTEDVIESDKLEEEHPLLDDAVKIFKGKMIS